MIRRFIQYAQRVVGLQQGLCRPHNPLLVFSFFPGNRKTDPRIPPEMRKAKAGENTAINPGSLQIDYPLRDISSIARPV